MAYKYGNKNVDSTVWDFLMRLGFVAFVTGIVTWLLLVVFWCFQGDINDEVAMFVGIFILPPIISTIIVVAYRILKTG